VKPRRRFRFREADAYIYHAQAKGFLRLNDSFDEEIGPLGEDSELWPLRQGEELRTDDGCVYMFPKRARQMVEAGDYSNYQDYAIMPRLAEGYRCACGSISIEFPCFCTQELRCTDCGASIAHGADETGEAIAPADASRLAKRRRNMKKKRKSIRRKRDLRLARERQARARRRESR